jgi:serine/threonine protein kinase
MNLEAQEKVHRDISYTNILLREGGDSDEIQAREDVMNRLGLSEVEELRKRLGCREGLLIDFDYAASLIGEPTTSEEKTGEGAPHDFKPVSGSRTVS